MGPNYNDPADPERYKRAHLQQKRDYDAGFLQKEFESSWRGGSQALKLDDLV